MENENAQGAHKKVSYSRLSCSTWYVVRTYTQTYEQPRYAHMRMLLAVVRTRTHPRSLNFMKKKLIYLFGLFSHHVPSTANIKLVEMTTLGPGHQNIIQEE